MSEKNNGYRALLSERNYIRYFIAGLVNRFGDSIDALAFAWMVYEITGDRAWSAVIFGLNALPSMLLMPFAGVLVERMDKRLVMIVADMGRAVIVALVGMLYMLGLARPWLLATTTLVLSSLEAFRIPAGLAIYPHIVPREKYTAATSLSQACGSVAVMLGTGAFGLVVATMGLQGAMFINAASFVISCALIYTIQVPPTPRPEGRLNATVFFGELKTGFRYLFGKKVILLICAVGSLLGVLMTPLDSLQTPYVRESLGQGEVALSVISIATMAGMMLGTALFPLVSRRVRKSALFVAGGLAISVGYVAYVGIASVAGVPQMLALLGACSFAYGLGGAQLQVVVNVAFMEQVDSTMLARVGSIFNAISMGLIPVASFLTAGLATVLTVNQIYVVFGLLTLLLFGALGFSSRLGEIDSPIAIKKEEADDLSCA